MNRQLTKDEIIERFDDALSNGNIYVCYQAQINHATGHMVGAEALVRWADPDYGDQYPSDFIPVLEDCGLVAKSDLYVFEQVCKLQRYCIDNKLPIVPISVNMSRRDIYDDLDYIGHIEEIRRINQIPVEHLRIEITEGLAVDGVETISAVLKRLHEIGYVVEMDDFGSGYSSLNILKELPVDVIKLDMRFLAGSAGSRGGTIIGSVVQMAKWLDTPVIAEGIETQEQADFMQSIGCYYIQGYLYSKPITKDEFLIKSKGLIHEPMNMKQKLFTDKNTKNFWNLDSVEVMLFHTFAGPSAIFMYENGNVEMLRMNKKYLKEMGSGLTEKAILGCNMWDEQEESEKKKYEDTIKRAIASHNEEECETWRVIHSPSCGDSKIYTRSTMKCIGSTETQHLFYVTIRNITADKEAYMKLAENEKKFRMASDQNNTFAWEFDIATKEMRPCSRCRKVLGFPEVMYNYPEPAIENGTFPEDYADMYREWHKRLETGEKGLEAVIPLTKDRIPFYVRYTAEFDENGRPYKAYGSATQVKDS